MSNKNSSVTNNPKNVLRLKEKRLAYIKNGLAKLFAGPQAIILTLPLLIVVIITWNAPVVLAAKLITIAALVPVFIRALRISILLVAVLLFIIILYLIGTPHKAREIENDLAAAFGIEKTSQFYRCPILMACKPVKGSTAKEYVFWSRWLDVGEWNRPERKRAILWALHAHSNEDFVVGKGRYTVTIRAADGAVPLERETP